jgi:flagellin
MTSTVGIRGADRQFLHSYRSNVERHQQSLERLSTGKRINRPSDDPPGFIAAEQLKGEIADLEAKLKSIGRERQQSHARQSELTSIQDTLQAVTDEVLAAADGFLSDDLQSALRDEIDQAADAIDLIIARSSSGQSNKGLSEHVNVTLRADEPTVAAVDAMADGALAEQAALAIHEHTHLDTFEALYEDQIVITTETLSMIEDTDFAAESANFAQSKILAQGAMAALSYYNHQRADQLLGLLDEIA